MNHISGCLRDVQPPCNQEENTLGGRAPPWGVKLSVDRWQRQVNQLRQCYSVKLLMEEIPVEVGNLSHHLQGFIHPRWRPSTVSFMIRCSCIRHRSIHVFVKINFWFTTLDQAQYWSLVLTFDPRWLSVPVYHSIASVEEEKGRGRSLKR